VCLGQDRFIESEIFRNRIQFDAQPDGSCVRDEVRKWGGLCFGGCGDRKTLTHEVAGLDLSVPTISYSIISDSKFKRATYYGRDTKTAAFARRLAATG
jgi:hypothetical protein